MGAKEDKVKGKWEETKGKGKQAWGDITDDPDKVDEGSFDKTKGKGRQKLGEAKEWIDEKTDDDK
ncbi:MAG: CsbD family protein [Sphaerobacteraceae bacterium]|nr:MAG: CsbD family protein [Sphaerobacteraceae bacterium]